MANSSRHRWLRQVRSQIRTFPMATWLTLLTFFGITVSIPGLAIQQVASPQEFHAVTAIVQRADNVAGVTGLLEQGQTLYGVGRFSEAVAVWQQTAETAQRQGDRLQQALSLSYLSLAYQKLGAWQQAEQAIAQSLERLEPHPSLDDTGTSILAQVLNTQGILQLAMGQPEAALATWEQAEQTYAQVGDESGKLGSQINQAQALQTAGLYRRAQSLLEQVNAQLQTQSDSMLKALGLRSLGTVLQVTGNLNESKKVLQQSLAIAQQPNLQLDTSETLFSLGNTLRALQETEAASKLYQQASEAAPTAIARLRAQLNQFSLFIETKQWQAAQAGIKQIEPQLVTLTPSREAIYAQVNFAASLIDITEAQKSGELGLSEIDSSLYSLQAIAQLLATAVQQAKELQDQRAESYALGNLGSLYEQTRQWSDAQSLTQKALLLAQSANAADIAYRWQWQLGRILKQQAIAHPPLKGEAIATYTEAVKTLESIRRDLLATNPEFQFSFREDVEPVYRELVELLVRPNASPADLQQAREAIEALQLAELENFFRSACLDPSQEIDLIDEKAAIFYSILLDNQLIVILSLPGQDLRQYTTQVQLTEVESFVENFRSALVLPYTSKQEIQPLSQQVYNWLVQPAEAALAESNIETLVFVQDGALRNIPAAALYDGKQYLIEKYNIARTPGLRLFEPKPLAQIPLRALTAGLTESRHDFAPLGFVEVELAQIRSKIPGEVLLNQDFTTATLASEVESSSFPIVHIATHGQFSSQSNRTFILAWDQPITVDRLSDLLQEREQNLSNALELLVLSACETAAGDKRAALGLAGVAVQAGARSTLASLWLVDDESTPLLMNQFYQGLKMGLSRAEALRYAQLTLLKGEYNHPRFWAAFVLLGNWR